MKFQQDTKDNTAPRTEKKKVVDKSQKGKKMIEKIENAVLRSLKNLR